MTNMSAGGISKRGAECAADNSLLTTGMKRAFERPFDPVTRVSGVINLGTAENKLLVREFAAKLKTEFAAGVTPKDLLYGDFNGEPELRSSLASMLSRHMGNFPIDPAHIVVQNGCGTVVESLAMVLCDPGDAFLILTPYYGGFDIDFVKRAGVQLLPVDLHSSNGYAVSIPDLERVLADARRRGINVRGFVISSPNNPLGSSYTRGELQSMVDFCHRHDLHFISDEIYLLSDFSSVIGKPESAVVPVLSLQIPDPSRVHIVWGFSKDFGASGLRVGLSYTRNPAVLSALQGLSYFTGVSRPLHVALQRMMADGPWVDSYIARNRRGLAESNAFLTLGLARIGLKALPCTAGMFVWVDFRACLHLFGKPGSREAELALWDRLIDNGLYIAPGAAFRCAEPGWFRIIFSAPHDILQLALDRIALTIQATSPRM